MQNVISSDRQHVAKAAARELERAREICVGVESTLLEAGWSRSEVDHFLIGIRDD